MEEKRELVKYEIGHNQQGEFKVLHEDWCDKKGKSAIQAEGCGHKMSNS
jgi:hypothetical protein